MSFSVFVISTHSDNFRDAVRPRAARDLFCSVLFDSHGPGWLHVAVEGLGTRGGPGPTTPTVHLRVRVNRGMLVEEKQAGKAPKARVRQRG